MAGIVARTYISKQSIAIVMILNENAEYMLLYSNRCSEASSYVNPILCDKLFLLPR